MPICYLILFYIYNTTKATVNWHVLYVVLVCKLKVGWVSSWTIIYLSFIIVISHKLLTGNSLNKAICKICQSTLYWVEMTIWPTQTITSKFVAMNFNDFATVPTQWTCRNILRKDQIKCMRNTQYNIKYIPNH